MTEADYICFLAKSISSGLYQKGGFIVLPRLVVDTKSVHFPDLDYSSAFWNSVKKCKAKNLGDIFPKSAIKEIASKLLYNNTSKTIIKDGLTIEVLETEYGTCGSYHVKKVEGKDRIFITRRKGGSEIEFEKTFFLAKLIIKNRDVAEIDSINWIKRQAVLEHFYGQNKSSLKIEDIKEGENYLEKLGFPNTDVIKDIDFKVFTVEEENLLNKLIEMKGEILTFDKTAEILWQDNSYDKYSPAAMAKVVENIRTKIKNQGINKEVIFTKRGKGYLFSG